MLSDVFTVQAQVAEQVVTELRDHARNAGTRSTEGVANTSFGSL